MKITIELDIPKNQKIPTKEDILRLTNPDWLISYWHIDDVKSINKKLSKKQCREVLRLIDHNHDANIGINWEVIKYTIDAII